MPTKKSIALMLFLSAGMGEAAAQSFADCRGQEVGAIPGLGKVSAYYGECSSTDQASGDEYHWALVINADSGNIEISRQLPGGLVPSPRNAVSIGIQDPLKFGVSDMATITLGHATKLRPLQLAHRRWMAIPIVAGQKVLLAAKYY